MKNTVKVMCATMCAVSVFAFAFPSFAMRSKAKGLPMSPKTVELPKDSSIDTFSENLPLTSDFDLIISDLKTPHRVMDISEFMINASTAPYTLAEFFSSANEVSDTWVVASECFKSTLEPISRMNVISLGLSSKSSRSIYISASARSCGTMDTMGLRVLRLQHYYKSRWVTVFTATNEYDYDISRFLFSTTRRNLVSGNYYRVVATFMSDTGSSVYYTTKTSGTIRCK